MCSLTLFSIIIPWNLYSSIWLFIIFAWLEKVIFYSNPQKGQYQGFSNYRTIMLISHVSKSFKLGFNNTWAENFQLYKLDLQRQKN